MFLNWKIVLHFILISIVYVESIIEFSLKITKYHTYSYRRLDGKCCGDSSVNSQSICLKPCLQRFKICLENYQAKVSSTDPKPYAGPCQYGMWETITWGNSNMNYDKEYIYSHLFIIKQSWPGYVMLIIEAYEAMDKRPYQRSVIDRVIYKNLLKPSMKSTKTKWHDVLLLNGRSVYQFSIQLACFADYYSQACDRYCKNNGGHYTCDQNGDKICEHGWMGSNCKTTICKAGCHKVHGFCPNPGECICREGWKGPYCDECIKYPGCKHGTCIDSPWTCHCESNWGGYFCDQSLNYCAENNPCKNGGICENQPSHTHPYKCICPSGFNGTNCEFDPCLPNPCQKGTCFRSKDGFHCQCFAGWIGKTCDQETSICSPNSCQNGGQCEKDENGVHRCVCKPGFKGSECHLSAPCENSQCKQAYDCQIQSTNQGDYKCNCHDGWTGKFCDKEIKECDNNPCRNNGVCKNIGFKFLCNCKLGFQGKNCELNVACESRPCNNGGVCQETDSDYICKCKKGYTGKNCEVYKTGCSPNPCFNGAYCYTIDQDFYCQCQSKYWGKRCEHARPYCGKEPCENAYDACAMPQIINSSGIKQNFCGKYGTCLSTGKKDFICRCMPGFEGPHCEVNIDDCKTNTCEAGGICIDGINDFECMCEPGYYGKRCDEKINLCNINPCLNRGQCKEMSTQSSNDFMCECITGWGGRLCHRPSNKACDESTCLNDGHCALDTSSPNGFTCHCKKNWSGSICQFLNRMEQPCNQFPCQNRGACVNIGFNDYSCHCPPGFEGKRCEININECHPNPCFNGGTCDDRVNSYKCNCAKGFYGSNCQLNFDECATHPCAYGAVCVDRIEDFECRCPKGRSGKLCDQLINNDPPQPPSCVYKNRIFDSGEKWSYNCQNCKCELGVTTCVKTICGVWSCLQANGTDDPYACKSDEVCHAYHFDSRRCFVKPCAPKAKCIKKHVEPPQATVTWPGDTNSDCQPNAIQKNNYCAQILLKFKKSNVPIGVTIDEICDSVKLLTSVISFRDTTKGKYLGISCDVSDRNPSIVNVAIYSTSDEMRRLKSTQTLRPFAHYLSDQIADDLVDVVRRNHTFLSGLVDIRVETLLLNPDSSDSTNLIKYMVVPIIIFGIIILFLVVWYHRKKTKEIREKYAPPSNVNNNNVQSQSLNPIRTQYPINRSDLITKHVPDPHTFYGGKPPQQQQQQQQQQQSRFAWPKLQHSFQT